MEIILPIILVVLFVLLFNTIVKNYTKASKNQHHLRFGIMMEQLRLDKRHARTFTGSAELKDITLKNPLS